MTSPCRKNWGGQKSLTKVSGKIRENYVERKAAERVERQTEGAADKERSQYAGEVMLSRDKRLLAMVDGAKQVRKVSW